MTGVVAVGIDAPSFSLTLPIENHQGVIPKRLEKILRYVTPQVDRGGGVRGWSGLHLR